MTFTLAFYLLGAACFGYMIGVAMIYMTAINRILKSKGRGRR